MKRRVVIEILIFMASGSALVGGGGVCPHTSREIRFSDWSKFDEKMLGLVEGSPARFVIGVATK